MFQVLLLFFLCCDPGGKGIIGWSVLKQNSEKIPTDKF